MSIGIPLKALSRLGTTLCLALVGFTPAILAESFLNFPRLSNQAGTITGVTIINPNDVSASVLITAYGTNGNQLSGPGIQNPVAVNIAPGSQYANVTAAIFGALPSSTVAWFQAFSDSDNLTGFFLFLNQALTEFDGADLPPLGRKIIFNQVRLGGGYSTEINIFNSESVRAAVDLFLISGGEVIEKVPGDPDFFLPGRGVTRLDVATFFGRNSVSADAYLLVISDTNVGGFEIIRQPSGDLLGLNARSLGETFNSIFFPQMAVLGPWKTEIGLTNYSPQAVDLILTAFRPDGRPFGNDQLASNPVFRRLEGGRGLNEDVEVMFGFAGSQALDGWIQVEASSQAVNGTITYGIPSIGSLASVAAVRDARQRAVFSHLATSLGFFTGVAALNSTSRAATYRVGAQKPDGSLIGVFDGVLRPGERFSRLITEMIPGADGQAGGLIWIESDRRLYFTSLFGTASGTVLANIPPQPIPDGFQPDVELARIQLSPVLAALSPEQAQEFDLLGPPLDNRSWTVDGLNGGDGVVGSIDSNGRYVAPSVLPAAGQVTIAVSGETGSGGQPQTVRAGATVDLILKEPLVENLSSVRGMAYSAATGLFYILNVLGDGTGAQGTPSGAAISQVLRVDTDAVSEVVAVSGQTFAGLALFTDSFGAEFLLTGSGNTVLRIDPRNGTTRQVASGLNGLTDLAFDPISGHLLASDSSGILRISRARLDSDTVSGLSQNGSPAARLLQSSDIRALAVDACAGSVYFQDSSGVIQKFDLAGGTVETVLSGLGAAEALVGLYRKDSACGDSFHLMTHDQARGEIILLDPSDNSNPIDWLEATGVSSFLFVPEGNEYGFGQAVLVAESSSTSPGQANPLQQVSLVQTPGLFQGRAVNPTGAPVESVGDPAFDTFGSGSVQPDLVELSIRPNGNNLEISAYFADPIQPCNAPCPPESPVQSLFGFVDLDVDQNPFTGLISTLDINTPYASGMGIEFCIELGSYESASNTLAAYRVVQGIFDFAGRVPVQFDSHRLIVTVPPGVLALNGPVNGAAVVGSPAEPTDGASNRGFVSSRTSPAATLAGVSATRTAGRRSWKLDRPGFPQPKRGMDGSN